MKAISILLLLTCVGCMGETVHSVSEPTCQTSNSYTPRNTDGFQSDWTVSLEAGTYSDDSCMWAGEVKWSNGNQTRQVETVLEFNLEGRIVQAPQDFCPDGPCGPNWSEWLLWEPM